MTSAPGAPSDVGVLLGGSHAQQTLPQPRKTNKRSLKDPKKPGAKKTKPEDKPKIEYGPGLDKHTGKPLPVITEDTGRGRVNEHGLVKPYNSDDNLCLIYAIYNALDEQHRIAFSGGDLDRPARRFLLFMNEIRISGADGYENHHVLQFFCELKKVGAIKGFHWAAIHGTEYRLFLSTKWRPNDIIAIFGISPARDEKEKAVKAIRKTESLLKDSTGQLEHAVRTALAEGVKHRASRITHGVSIKIIEPGTDCTGGVSLLYDTGNNSIPKLSPTSFARSIEKVFAMYRLRFDM